MCQTLYLSQECEERVWRVVTPKLLVSSENILLQLVQVLDEKSERLAIEVASDLDFEVFSPLLG